MKKKIISLLAVITCVGGMTGCSEPINTYEALSSIAYNNANGCDTSYVTVLVNNKEKKTKEEIAAAIIEKYISNTLEGILFSFDEMGYAETLEVQVDAADSDEDGFRIEYQRASGEDVVYSMEIDE